MNLRITSGSLKNRRFSVPATDLRPTEEKIRSAFFNTLFSMIEFEGRSFLDIFSGSGAMAFESLSRGFKNACVIENNPKAVEKIRSNAELLNLSGNVKIIRNDAFKSAAYASLDQKFQTVYIDPPYSMGGEISGLLDQLKISGITGEICVIGVENDKEIVWQAPEWNRKIKKFGNTFLTIFYNWEKNDEEKSHLPGEF